MISMKIAVLESDRIRSAAICRVLESGGYECAVFSSGKKFYGGMNMQHIDLLIAGKVRGQSQVQIIRDARSMMQPKMPILMLVANGETDVIEQALAAGTTDYLCLPVRAAELKTRISVMLALAYPEQMARERMQYGDFEFDTHTRQAKYAGKPIRLTRREFELALLFFRNLAQPLSRATIGEAVWGEGMDILSRTIDTHVSRVRSKLNLRPENGYQLVQVYGYGYRLERAEAPES